MTTKQAQTLFEYYNNVADVQRAPRGKAYLRQLLDIHAIAAVNLYGVISLGEFTDIFTKQTKEQVTPAEVEQLLLPAILKNKYYCFYAGYVVHYLLMEDFDAVQALLQQQGDKPRFIPSEKQFLNFTDEYYDDLKTWEHAGAKLADLAVDFRTIRALCYELHLLAKYNFQVQYFSEAIQEYQLPFINQEAVNRFFDITFAAVNQTRMWENKGFTPEQLSQRNKKITPLKQARPEPIKQVGRNEPCVCGSGKKYKKCCYLKEVKKSAQLSESEAQLFYNTWYRLLRFTNETFALISPKLIHLDPAIQEDHKLHEVAAKVWEQPDVIPAFIKTDKTLTPEQQALLQSWYDKHQKGQFLIIAYDDEYAVFMSQQDKKLYGVKGVLNPISKVMQRELPQAIETVLIPFGDTIIYAAYIASYNVKYSQSLKEMLGNAQTELMQVAGIQTTL